jgi:hypothetical protein
MQWVDFIADGSTLRDEANHWPEFIKLSIAKMPLLQKS